MAGIPLAAGVPYPFFGVLQSPVVAAAGMALSSVSGIANALSLRTATVDATRLRYGHVVCCRPINRSTAMRITSCSTFAALPAARQFAAGADLSWHFLRKVWFRRAVAALVLLAFLPVVSAMVVCEAECLARELAGGSVPAGADHARHDGHAGGGTVPGGHLHGAGHCHMAATPILLLAAGVAVDPVPIGNRWIAQTSPCFDSVAWPPPRPRPKLSSS